VSPGSHGPDDGSSRHAGGIQVGRAVILVGIAAIVGIVLLHRGTSGATRVASSATTTTTVKGGGGTTRTTVTTPTTTLPVHPPAQVKVLVANGSGVTGLAGLVSTRLRTGGYDTLASVNANQRVAASVVYYAPGYQREAAILAQSLGLAPTSVQPMPTPPPVASLGTANVLVVAGPDLAQGGATTTVPTTAHVPTTLHTSTTVHTATTLHTTTTLHVTTTVTTVKP
jgi:hypothetical protein